MNKHKDHVGYYLALIGLLIGGVILIISLYPRKDLQMIAIIGLSIIYFLLGILHHIRNHDLVLKIVVEYILIAGLGIAAAFFIYRGGIGI